MKSQIKNGIKKHYQFLGQMLMRALLTILTGLLKKWGATMANNLKDGEALMLTKSQIDNLIEFFELEFIGMVRKDDCIDNMDYVCDMCDIYKGLKSLQREMDGKEVQE